MRILAALSFLIWLPLWAADDPFAAQLYTKHCAQCHDQGADARVPPRAALEKMSPAAVLRVFLAGPDSVYSLDAVTGCVHWATEAAAAIRSGLTVAPLGEKTLVIFGDVTGQVRALDASTGSPVWQLRADDHPATMVTSTPAFYNGRLYVGVSSFEEVRSVTAGYVCCSFRGRVQALDAATGQVPGTSYPI